MKFTSTLLTLGLSLPLLANLQAQITAQDSAQDSAQNSAPDATAKETTAAESQLAWPAIGSDVPNELASVKWLQGGPIANFNQEGVIYLVDLWATWCGPCIAAMPHMVELQKKYADQGVQVVGISVFGDKESKITDFIASHPDIKYPIAAGSDTEFETKVVRGAGVAGIPHVLIIQNGKLIYREHPMKVTDEIIDEIIAGKFDAKAHEHVFTPKERETTALSRATDDAIRTKDAVALREVAAQIVETVGHTLPASDGCLIGADVIEGKFDDALAKIDAQTQLKDNSSNGTNAIRIGLVIIAPDAGTSPELDAFYAEALAKVQAAIDVTSKEVSPINTNNWTICKTLLSDKINPPAEEE